MTIARDFRLTDSTLRDGSHALAHQFTPDQVRSVVSALDGAGVPVIEISHGDGLGGSSFNYGFSHTDERELLRAAADVRRNAKLAV
ncbi:MAG: 4-hydroxy-2-oxovalerate aldolase, partial [Actinomycetota bacterium]|nr:4-hydroxy-2-oxovalerate aldolase [Actinomycetota bacterium]